MTIKKADIIDAMVSRIANLCEHAFDKQLDWDRFNAFTNNIDESFEVRSTTFSQNMCALLWGISKISNAKTVVGIGTYVGFTFAWLMDKNEFSGCKTKYYAIDIDDEIQGIARTNLLNICDEELLDVICSDGHEFLNQFDGNIDILYIDVDSPENGKADYTSLLETARSKLAPGAIILAHDACVPRFAEDIDRYTSFTQNSEWLKGPWILKVDPCGLAVSTVAQSQ